MQCAGESSGQVINFVGYFAPLALVCWPLGNAWPELFGVQEFVAHKTWSGRLAGPTLLASTRHVFALG